MSSQSGGSSAGDTSGSSFGSIDTVLLTADRRESQLDVSAIQRQSLFIENIDENKSSLTFGEANTSSSKISSNEKLSENNGRSERLYPVYVDDSKHSASSSNGVTSTPSPPSKSNILKENISEKQDDLDEQDGRDDDFISAKSQYSIDEDDIHVPGYTVGENKSINISPGRALRDFNVRQNRDSIITVSTSVLLDSAQDNILNTPGSGSIHPSEFDPRESALLETLSPRGRIRHNSQSHDKIMDNNNDKNLMEKIKSRREENSANFEREIKLLEEEVSKPSYVNKTSGNVPKVGTIDELQRFAQEERGRPPLEHFKTESEFVPLEFNLSRRNSQTTSSFNGSPSINTFLSRKSSPENKLAIPQSPSLISKILVPSPVNSNRFNDRNISGNSGSSGSSSRYRTTSNNSQQSLIRQRRNGDYVAIPVLRTVSGSGQWRAGSESNSSLRDYTPTRQRFEKFRLETPESLVLPDIEPHRQSDIPEEMPYHDEEDNDRDNESVHVKQLVEPGTMELLEPEEAYYNSRDSPRDNIKISGNVQPLYSNKAVAMPHEEDDKQTYGRISSIEDHVDVEAFGDMIRIRHDDGEVSTVQSINSHDYAFSDLYSIKRIIIVMTLCFVSPPLFFLMGVGYKRANYQRYLVSDYKLMRMLMNPDYRQGLLKGFVWEVDLTWFRRLCLVLGTIEMLCAFAGIGIGFGVGLTR